MNTSSKFANLVVGFQWLGFQWLAFYAEVRVIDVFTIVAAERKNLATFIAICVKNRATTISHVIAFVVLYNLNHINYSIGI